VSLPAKEDYKLDIIIDTGTEMRGPSRLEFAKFTLIGVPRALELSRRHCDPASDAIAA
jgi:Holliday junction resolvasome RuvABC ATP-dependent DNA helicase subunit